jgi:hypothetical protein
MYRVGKRRNNTIEKLSLISGGTVHALVSISLERGPAQW